MQGTVSIRFGKPHREEENPNITPFQVWVATSDDDVYHREYQFLLAMSWEQMAITSAYTYLCGKYGLASFVEVYRDGQFFHPNSPATKAPGSPMVDAYVVDVRQAKAQALGLDKE